MPMYIAFNCTLIFLSTRRVITHIVVMIQVDLVFNNTTHYELQCATLLTSSSVQIQA